MEIVCAGFPKTGTKSCSAALRELGYKVADYPETANDLSYAWKQFLFDNGTIETVIAEYQKYGYQANQDMPGNSYFEPLFRASPNAKVIMTVRDNETAWFESLSRFFKQEYGNFGNPAFYLFLKFNDLRMSGPRMLNMMDIGKIVYMRWVEPSLKIGKGNAKNL